MNKSLYAELTNEELNNISGGNRYLIGGAAGAGVSMGVRWGAKRFIVSNAIRTGATMGAAGGPAGVLIGFSLGVAAAYLGDRYL